MLNATRTKSRNLGVPYNIPCLKGRPQALALIRNSQLTLSPRPSVTISSFLSSPILFMTHLSQKLALLPTSWRKDRLYSMNNLISMNLLTEVSLCVTSFCPFRARLASPLSLPIHLPVFCALPFRNSAASITPLLCL